MRRAVTVGNGFGKKTLEKAIEQIDDGDTLLLDPGKYNYPQGFGWSGRLKIRGNGANVSDVVLNFPIEVKSSGYLQLENLTMEMRSQQNCILRLNENAQLSASNVTIHALGGEYSPVYLNHATLALTASEFHNSGKKGTTFLQATNGSYVVAKSADLENVGLDASKMDIQTSQIRGWIALSNNSEVNADTLYFDEPEAGYYHFFASSGSLLNFQSLNLPEGTVTALLENSKMQATGDNIDEMHRLVATVDETSELNVPGAEVKQPQRENSNAQNDTPTVDDEPETESTESETNTEEQPTAEVEEEPVVEEERAIDKINDLIGLESVKEAVSEFIGIAKFNQERRSQGLSPVVSSLHSVFYGNPGTGKTTVARLVAQAMFEEGVMPKDNYVEVSRQDLVSDNVGGTAKQTKRILDQARGGVLFIDEAYTLYQSGGTNWGQEAVDTILKYMEDHRDDLMIIFAGYTKEMQDFINMNPGMESRIANKFTFEDYSPDDIAMIGEKSLKHNQFEFDEEYYKTAVIKAYKADVSHSNGRWVRNFNDDLIRLAVKNIMQDKERDQVTIINSDIDELTGGDDESKGQSVDELLAKLDGMIGLKSVKNFVHDLVDQVEVNNTLEGKLNETEKPTYHMVFAGDPGTGKTTVARLIAQLFYNLGILPKNTVSEVSRPDLVGRYIGETEEKTGKVIRDAQGGVLFVDEAYQLTASTSSNDFGKQAVETFITELENNRDSFITIFAGYTNEMDSFLQANPGLRSRIPLTIEFESYTPDEIAEIVASILTKNFTLDETLLKRLVVQHYAALPKEDQANGRWARNFANEVIKHHKLWLVDNIETADVNNIDDSVLMESLSWKV